MPRWVVPVAAAIALIVGAGFSVTVISPSDRSAGSHAQSFSAQKFAATNFTRVVVPYVKSHAQPIASLLTELATDRVGTEKKYGHDSGTGSAVAFPVTLTATAGDVSNGLLALSVPGLTAGGAVYLQVGPAINGSALRDVSGKFPFGAFANQIDYLNSSLALNAEAKSHVLSALDLSSITGRSVIVEGAFLESVNPGFVSIVPTSVQVLP